ncbi:MAG: HAMP domain-containing histidine kinase [Clostridiales Family XIII bacterium]|jgi:signal transduction histidine kinase|nr:HAMP domain-containing histidine kinase [Clostridiales Family XIII bacterium]
MLKRLKVKIVAVVLGTLLVVFAAVLLVLNLSVYQTSDNRAEEFMISVVENDGFSFPQRARPGMRRQGGHEPFGGPEMMKAGRFFYAKIDNAGEILELNLEMMFEFSKEDAQGFITSAADSGKLKGNIENYSFLKAEKPYGQILVFAERSIEINLLSHLTRTSLWAAGAVSLVLACLSAFFAKWMVAPVKTAFDKQREFISDASHELKTPLTIISANVEVLQNEIGENQRLSHIKAQSDRMNGLVHELLSLAKADEERTGLIRSEFDLSSAILNTVLEFESRAFEEGKQYLYSIDEGIRYVGDEKQIKQLAGILIDNAIRYSDAAGQVKASLLKEGGHSRITVFNTGIGVADEEHDKIFERFYRCDESRSRETGGYGIGLSIAGAIVKAHKGKMGVTGEFGKWIQFDVLL